MRRGEGDRKGEERIGAGLRGENRKLRGRKIGRGNSNGMEKGRVWERR